MKAVGAISSERNVTSDNDRKCEELLLYGP